MPDSSCRSRWILFIAHSETLFAGCMLTSSAHPPQVALVAGVGRRGLSGTLGFLIAGPFRFVDLRLIRGLRFLEPGGGVGERLLALLVVFRLLARQLRVLL